jgi:hypothetical protein
MSPITYTTLHRSNLGPIYRSDPPRQHPFSTGNIGLFEISYGTETFINPLHYTLVWKTQIKPKNKHQNKTICFH